MHFHERLLVIFSFFSLTFSFLLAMFGRSNWLQCQISVYVMHYCIICHHNHDDVHLSLVLHLQ